MDESILTTGAIDIVSTFASWFPAHKFYLSEGTALALHIGHRRSKDLDFFTQQSLTVLPKLSEFENLLAHFASAEWTHQSPEQIDWRLNGIAITLLAYPFAHNFEFHAWRGLSVADPRDIALQKAYTLGRRAQARDYVDLHVIIKSEMISIDEIISRAQRTYGSAFSPRLFLQQLTYTNDLTDRDKNEAVNLLIEPKSFATVEQDLQRMVQDWMEGLTVRRPRYSNDPQP